MASIPQWQQIRPDFSSSNRALTSAQQGFDALGNAGSSISSRILAQAKLDEQRKQAVSDQAYREEMLGLQRAAGDRQQKTFDYQEAVNRAQALNAGLDPYTTSTRSVQVPGQVSAENLNRLQLLQQEKDSLGVIQPQDAPSVGSQVGIVDRARTLDEMNIDPKYTTEESLVTPGYDGAASSVRSIVQPVDVKSTIPSYAEVKGIRLPETAAPAASESSTKAIDWSYMGQSAKTDPITKAVEKGTNTKPVTETINRSTTPTRAVEAIQKEMDNLSKVSPKTVERSITELTRLDPNDISNRLTEQYISVYGKEPTGYDKAAIGVRTKEVYERLYNEQKDQKKYELDKASKEANMDYMKAMTRAMNKPASSKSSKEGYTDYKEVAKHKEGWDKNRIAMVTEDIGDSDTEKANRYMNLMEELNLPPAKGEAFIAAIKNQPIWGMGDKEPTAEAINMAVGGMQALSIDPITGKKTFLPLGEAIVEADRQGWRLALVNGQVQLIK